MTHETPSKTALHRQHTRLRDRQVRQAAHRPRLQRHRLPRRLVRAEADAVLISGMHMGIGYP